mgnify:CR=1 FL=1
MSNQRPSNDTRGLASVGPPDAWQADRAVYSGRTLDQDDNWLLVLSKLAFVREHLMKNFALKTIVQCDSVLLSAGIIILFDANLHNFGNSRSTYVAGL